MIVTEEERALELAEKFLGTSNIKNIEKVTLEDRRLSTRGWQYKRIGNSSAGSDKLKFYKDNYELIEDTGKCARNDSDLRYYNDIIFRNDNELVRATTSPSRSGKNCTYNFLIITTNTKEEDIYEKLIKDINNHDLFLLGLPDSTGSFMKALMEDELGLDWEQVKDKPMKVFINAYKEWKNDKRGN